MFSLNCVWFHFIFETKLWMGYLQIWIALNLVLFKIVQFTGLLLDSVWFSLLHFSNEILFDLAYWGGFCWMALFIHIRWVLLDIIWGRFWCCFYWLVFWSFFNSNNICWVPSFLWMYGCFCYCSSSFYSILVTSLSPGLNLSLLKVFFLVKLGFFWTLWSDLFHSKERGTRSKHFVWSVLGWSGIAWAGGVR